MVNSQWPMANGQWLSMKHTIVFFSLLLLFACTKKSQTDIVTQPLSQDWTLSSDTLVKDLPVTIPSVVQASLYDANIIPHPYLGTVEDELLWISDHPWSYTLHFDAKAEILDKDCIQLEFQGLDTYAKVYLNDSLLLTTDNMFRTWSCDVKDIIKKNNNILYVYFDRFDSVQQAVYESHLPRFPERYAVTRKCGYQHGWDWAPKYKNVGIWKPVTLKAWSQAYIESAYVVTESVSPQEARLTLHLDVNSTSACDYQVALKVSPLSQEDSYVRNTTCTFHLDPGTSHKTQSFTIDNPELWWPNEMGKQCLYCFDVTLSDEVKVLDTKQIVSGIRQFEMVQEPDEAGSSLYFKVNGVPFYAKGANYIPEEMVETWMDSNHTLSLLQDAKEAHFNMLRVWGGGVYPSDDFFSICDSLGILVWEDFMYAGTMYPYDEAFFNNVSLEAIGQVKRLASHPSLALWCGGNEISEGYYNWGWQSSLSWSEEDDLAMKAGYDRLFEYILPEAIAAYDGTRPYWPSSPSKGWGRPESLTQGDVHYWGVWWGEQPYEIYREKVGRFNSEYGYQGYPDITTLKQMDVEHELQPILECSDSEALYPLIEKNNLLAAHQKHARGTRQINDFIVRYYPQPKDFGDYVYLSQLSQAYGMGIAIEAHRAAKPYNNGTLYWQLNDAWPVTSWSSIDYYGRKKALQYQLKSLYAPILLGVMEGEFAFVCSDLQRPLRGRLIVQMKDMEGDVTTEESVEVALSANENKHYHISPMSFDQAQGHYFDLSFYEADTMLVAERLCYQVNPKDLALLPVNEENLRMDVQIKGKDVVVTLESDILVKDIQLYTKEGEATFSDNYFDLQPGEKRTVVCSNLRGSEKILYRTLNQLKY